VSVSTDDSIFPTIVGNCPLLLTKLVLSAYLENNEGLKCQRSRFTGDVSQTPKATERVSPIAMMRGARRVASHKCAERRRRGLHATHPDVPTCLDGADGTDEGPSAASSRRPLSCRTRGRGCKTFSFKNASKHIIKKTVCLPACANRSESP
jgi:hypothetical protein